MARATVDPADIARTTRKIDRLKETFTRIVEEEDARSANNIVKVAKQLVPVITGEVRDSIKAEKDKDGYIIGSDLKDKGKTGLFIVDELEHGTRTRPAKPFLLPAFKQELPKHKQRVQKRMKDEIRKARRW